MGVEEKASNTMKKKAKKRKSKHLNKNIGSEQSNGQPVISAPKRDFQQDLTAYLDAWTNRNDGSEWKFNKVLQSWAVQHALDESVVDKGLFKRLIPYLASMAGQQRQRFLDSIDSAIENGDSSQVASTDGTDSTAEGKAQITTYNRAIKLRNVMTETDSA